MEGAFSQSVNEVLANFDVDQDTGLSDGQVHDLRNQFGRNGMFGDCPATTRREQ